MSKRRCFFAFAGIGILALAAVAGNARRSSSAAALGEDTAPPPAASEPRVDLLFTVNNLGFTDTCG